MRSPIAACVAAAIAIAPAVARAQEPERAEVSLPARARVLLPFCDPPPFEPGELLASLRVELLGLGVELVAAVGGAGDEPPALIVVDAPGCEPRHLVVRVERPLAGRSASREVDLADRPLRDRSRVLALSIAELLRTQWASLAAGDPAPAAAAPPAAAAEPPPIDDDVLRRETVRAAVAELEDRRRLARWPAHRVLIGAVATGALHPMHDSGLLGGGLFVDLELARSVPVHLGIDVAYRNGGGSDPLGMVRTQTATGGLALRYQAGTGRLRGGLGARVELGWCRIEGDPIVPGYGHGRGDGFVLSLAVDGVVEVRLSRRLWMVVGLDLGYVLVGLDAVSAVRHPGGVAGLAIGASLGLAVGL